MHFNTNFSSHTSLTRLYTKLACTLFSIYKNSLYKNIDARISLEDLTILNSLSLVHLVSKKETKCVREAQA